MALRIQPGKRLKKKLSGHAEEILAKLDSYLKEGTAGPVELLCGFWKDQQDAITYQELREAVMSGALSESTFRLWQQDYSVLVAGKLEHVWERAMAAGAANQPLTSGLPFVFHTQTPGIRNWIQERGAEFVTSSTVEQKNAIAALLSKKMVEGHTVDELARMIRPCIGLTEGQAKANARYYDSIVANLKKEHPRMKQESIQRKAQEAAMKYAERQHRYRAMTIAMTESAFAYNRGADEGVRQAQAQGLLGAVKKRWCTSGDDQVCSICQGLEGVELGMDDGFQFKGRQLFAGQNLMPPAHPRCACAVEYIETTSDVNYEASSLNISEDTLYGEKKDFLTPNSEEAQDYKEVKIDATDVRSDRKSGIVVSSQRVTTAKNVIYVSENVNLSRRDLHKIDVSISEAAKILKIKDMSKLPPVVIASVSEMNIGTLASYVPYSNVMFMNECITDKNVLMDSQSDFASSKNKIATYVHELIHWMDAEQYRAKHGMIDEDYFNELRAMHKKIIDKLEKQGYNIDGISEYASSSLEKKQYDEVYTEYRVKQLLGG